MSNHFLNLHGDYSAEVLSYYLWGQAKAPTPSELADPKWMERKDKATCKPWQQDFQVAC